MEESVGDLDLREFPDQGEILVFKGVVAKFTLHFLAGYEGDVINVVHPLRNSVRDKQITLPVVIEVNKQGGPAPVSSMDTRELADLPETAVAPVQLEVIAGILMGISVADLLPVNIVIIFGKGTSQQLGVIRQHVHGHDVGPGVIVDVGRIHTHAELTGMSQPRGGFLAEGAITLVHVEVVVLVKVIPYIDVRSAIEIDVCHDDTKAISDTGTAYTGRS